METNVTETLISFFEQERDTKNTDAMKTIISLRKQYQRQEMNIRTVLRQSYYDKRQIYEPLPEPSRRLTKTIRDDDE